MLNELKVEQVYNNLLNKPEKKILHIVEAMGGGVFTYIVDLANQLSLEYEVYIAYSTRPQTPKDYRSYFNKNIKLIEVKNFKRSVSLIKDLKAFLEIQRIKKKINPDIIHLHSSKAGALGRWAFNGRKIPLFYTPHGYSFLMKNYGLIKRTIYRTIEGISSRRCCTTISCSFGEYEETLKLTKKALYVNNGIDINELKDMIDEYEVNKDSDNTFTVFTIGRICHQKNPEMFNSIAEKLPNIKFLWIGDGELRDKLSSPNIEITGWLDRKKVLKYAINANIFLLTSLWEGLPISLLESMYMKKLCVVSNVIGNRDVIRTGYNGFICGEIGDFIDIINKSINGIDKIIINNAYQDILKEYNTIVMGEKYKNIYSKSYLESKAYGKNIKNGQVKG